MAEQLGIVDDDGFEAVRSKKAKQKARQATKGLHDDGVAKVVASAVASTAEKVDQAEENVGSTGSEVPQEGGALQQTDFTPVVGKEAQHRARQAAKLEEASLVAWREAITRLAELLTIKGSTLSGRKETASLVASQHLEDHPLSEHLFRRLGVAGDEMVEAVLKETEGCHGTMHTQLALSMLVREHMANQEGRRR